MHAFIVAKLDIYIVQCWQRAQKLLELKNASESSKWSSSWNFTFYTMWYTTVIQFINLTVNNVFVSAIKFNVLTLTAHKDEKEKPSV